MPDSLTLSPAVKDRLGKSMLRDYLSYIRKSPNKTPNQLIDVIYFGRKRWFDAMEEDDLDFFNKIFEDASLAVDIDVHWDVSIKKQLQASKAFNNFLFQMKRYYPTQKQDAKVVTRVLNETFGKEFGISSNSSNIIKSFSRDPQLKMVGRRMVEELSKLGYKF